LTAVRDGRVREVALRKSSRERRDGPVPGESNSIIVGRLSFADATKPSRQQIKVVDDKGVAHPATVRTGMMTDIVKPLWEDRVRAYLVRRRKTNYLERIEKVGENVTS